MAKPIMEETNEKKGHLSMLAQSNERLEEIIYELYVEGKFNDR